MPTESHNRLVAKIRRARTGAKTRQVWAFHHGETSPWPPPHPIAAQQLHGDLRPVRDFVARYREPGAFLVELDGDHDRRGLGAVVARMTDRMRGRCSFG